MECASNVINTACMLHTVRFHLIKKIAFNLYLSITNPKLVTWSWPILTNIEPMITSSDPTVTYSDLYWPFTHPLTSIYLTWPILSLILEIKRLAGGRWVVVVVVATKFSVKHQGKDNHHPPSISINDLHRSTLFPSLSLSFTIWFQIIKTFNFPNKALTAKPTFTTASNHIPSSSINKIIDSPQMNWI